MIVESVWVFFRTLFSHSKCNFSLQTNKQENKKKKEIQKFRKKFKKKKKFTKTKNLFLPNPKAKHHYIICLLFVSESLFPRSMPKSLFQCPYLKAFSHLYWKACFHRKACFCVCVGKPVSMSLLKSMFPNLHGKSVSRFMSESLFPPKSFFVSASETMFPCPHQKACFYIWVEKSASMFMSKLVSIRNPVSISALESLFPCLCLYLCRKACVYIYIGKSVWIKVLIHTKI